MAILVCGGAGYIGSHAVHALAAAGQEVVVVDNLQTGHAAAVAGKAAFVQGDIRDAACLDGIFRRFRIDGVMHFAADSQVGESMVDPLKYFNNNVGGMQSLLEAMVRHGVGRIVFSSSAAMLRAPKKPRARFQMAIWVRVSICLPCGGIREKGNGGGSHTWGRGRGKRPPRLMNEGSVARRSRA